MNEEAKLEIDSANEKGVALLECLMVLPVIMFMIFGALEYTRVMELSEAAIYLSRETANFIFFECRDSGTDSKAPKEANELAITACLNKITGTIKLNAVAGLPNVAVIASVFDWDGTQVKLRKSVKACDSSKINSNWNCDTINSKISVQKVNDKYSDILKSTGTLAIAEVYVGDSEIFEKLNVLNSLAAKVQYGISVF